MKLGTSMKLKLLFNNRLKSKTSDSLQPKTSSSSTLSPEPDGLQRGGAYPMSPLNLDVSSSSMFSGNLLFMIPLL